MTQNGTGILKLPLLVSALLLIISTLAVWPRWYYVSTRTIICGTAIYVIWHCFRTRHRVWAVLLAMIAVLFNPIFLIRFSRGPWHAVEVVAALVFVISAFGLSPETGSVDRLKKPL